MTSSQFHQCALWLGVCIQRTETGLRRDQTACAEASESTAATGIAGLLPIASKGSSVCTPRTAARVGVKRPRDPRTEKACCKRPLNKIRPVLQHAVWSKVRVELPRAHIRASRPFHYYQKLMCELLLENSSPQCGVLPTVRRTR